jgi:hypothetical protein
LFCAIGQSHRNQGLDYKLIQEDKSRENFWPYSEGQYQRGLILDAGGVKYGDERLCKQVAEYPSQAVVSSQGAVFRVHELGARGHAIGGIRGKVKGFSAAARKRMIDRIGTCDWAAVDSAMFVTLTWGAFFPRDMDSIKVCLWRFRRRLERYLRKKYEGRKFPIIWRLAPQDGKRSVRGKPGRFAPHFHLLVMGLRYLNYQAVRRMWAGCIEGYLSDEERDLVASGCGLTDVELVMGNQKRVCAYVAAYAAEVAGTALDNIAYLAEWGRCWGIWNAEWLPWAELKEYHFRGGRWLKRLRRSSRRLYKVRSMRGWTLYSEDAAKWLDLAVHYAFLEFVEGV